MLQEVRTGHQSNDGSIKDIVDGSLYKNCPSFEQNPETLAILLYFDEFTVSNPLRVKSKKYKILACYMTLANIAPERRSQLDSIQLVSLCQSQYVKLYGLKSSTQVLYEELQDLIQRGLDIQIADRNIHFSCDLLAVLGDNLSQHQFGGSF